MINQSIPRIEINPIKSNIDYLGNDFAIFDDINVVPLNCYPSRVNGIVLALIERGSMNISIDLNQYNLTEDSLLITFPEQIIQMPSHSEDCEGLFMVISPSFMEKIFQSSRDFLPFHFIFKKRPVIKLNHDEAEIVKCYHDKIQNKIRKELHSFKREVINGLIYALFYDVYNMIDHHYPEKESYVKTRKESVYEKFIHEVSNNYKEKRSVSYYADKLCLTAKHLSSVVKEVSGKTAGEWIDNFVILEAKALLKSSDMSIQEIAEHLNFANQSFFGKYFKHYIGMSPKAYRRS